MALDVSVGLVFLACFCASEMSSFFFLVALMLRPRLYLASPLPFCGSDLAPVPSNVVRGSASRCSAAASPGKNDNFSCDSFPCLSLFFLHLLS